MSASRAAALVHDHGMATPEPKRVVVVELLPTTPMGKVRKQGFVAYLGGLSASFPASSQAQDHATSSGDM